MTFSPSACSLHELGNFHEKCNLPKFGQAQRENGKSPVFIKDTEPVVINPPSKETPGPLSFIDEPHQMFKEVIIPNVCNRETEEEGTHPTVFLRQA